MTLVVDASVIAEVVMGTDKGILFARDLRHDRLAAPNIIVAEVTQVVRKNTLRGTIPDERARFGLENFAALNIFLFDMEDFMVEAWELRHHVTAYDAIYVVLARQLKSRLLTMDQHLVEAAPDCAFLP